MIGSIPGQRPTCLPPKYRIVDVGFQYCIRMRSRASVSCENLIVSSKCAAQSELESVVAILPVIEQLKTMVRFKIRKNVVPALLQKLCIKIDLSREFVLQLNAPVQITRN